MEKPFFSKERDKGFTPHHQTFVMVWGFTLAETIIVVAIFTLVVGVISSAIIYSQKSFTVGQDDAEMIQNGRVIMERMSREIRQAKQIITSLPEERINPPSEIKFQDGHLIDDSFYYIHYYRDPDNNVLREVTACCFSENFLTCVFPENYVSCLAIPPENQTLLEVVLESPMVIGEYVSNLEFYGAKVINIFLELNVKNQTMQLETKVFGRNL